MQAHFEVLWNLYTWLSLAENDPLCAPRQIQAFNVTSGRFSPVSDCTTFLTPAILMGLVTSLILLLVLAYALHLLVHLNRIENDRERKAHGDFLRNPEQMERCCPENIADKNVP